MRNKFLVVIATWCLAGALFASAQTTGLKGYNAVGTAASAVGVTSETRMETATSNAGAGIVQEGAIGAGNSEATVSRENHATCTYAYSQAYGSCPQNQDTVQQHSGSWWQ